MAKFVTPSDSPIFPIGIYYESIKSKDMLFFDLFMKEWEGLLKKQLTVNEHHLKIGRFCFSADAPARAFLKGIVPHNGYYGCEKCITRGK